MADTFKSEILANGATVPFTGQWVPSSQGRNALIVTYVSGSSVDFSIQGKTELQGLPIFADGGSAEAFLFYKETGVRSGYSTPLFFDSPIAEIRMVATGSGKVWSFINYQN
ncbi:MAG: hypothetical protein RL736_1083 [Pseudomonadota bacterium]|jgi:hypothetical protein